MENNMDSQPRLGIIGGTGVYQFEALTNVVEKSLETPFGQPSSPLILGEIENHPVAFLARHGIGHILSPSEINYRANIYALKMVGVNRLISISACGSLLEDFAPGDIVIPDQLVDFTRGRERTFFEKGLVAHIGTAEPFCSDLAASLYQAVSPLAVTVHRGGTFITIEGPRFSTRAESLLFRQWGMSIIGMTTSPEAFLAREAEICYAAFAHVTDYDVWREHEEAVNVEMIIGILQKNSEIAQKAIVNLAKHLNDTQCSCQSALKTAITTSPTYIDMDQRKKLDILIRKYLP